MRQHERRLLNTETTLTTDSNEISERVAKAEVETRKNQKVERAEVKKSNKDEVEEENPSVLKLSPKILLKKGENVNNIETVHRLLCFSSQKNVIFLSFSCFPFRNVFCLFLPCEPL